MWLHISNYSSWIVVDDIPLHRGLLTKKIVYICNMSLSVKKGQFIICDRSPVRFLDICLYNLALYVLLVKYKSY